MRKYTFSGAGNARSDGRGPTTVIADNEAEARHLAMVERWGHPNGQPAQDVDSRTGRYLSHGLSLVSTAEVR